MGWETQRNNGWVKESEDDQHQYLHRREDGQLHDTEIESKKSNCFRVMEPRDKGAEKLGNGRLNEILYNP